MLQKFIRSQKLKLQISAKFFSAKTSKFLAPKFIFLEIFSKFFSEKIFQKFQTLKISKPFKVISLFFSGPSDNA